MKIQNKKILIYDISSKDVKTFLHTSTVREKKKKNPHVKETLH